VPPRAGRTTKISISPLGLGSWNVCSIMGDVLDELRGRYFIGQAGL
jgi:hypothetical protein